jgi:hypothetical protein
VGAVVPVRAADQVHPLRRAVVGVEGAGDLRRGVDGVAAAGAQEDLAAGLGRERAEAVGELERGAVGVVAERAVRVERAQLARDGVRDLRATVPEVRVPQRGGRVEVAPALLVPHPDALGAGEHELRAGDGAHVGEGMPEGVHGLDYRAHATVMPSLFR